MDLGGGLDAAEVGDQAGVPLSIRGGGPIVNTTGGQETTSRLPVGCGTANSSTWLVRASVHCI